MPPILYLIFLHFIVDWELQKQWTVDNKSKHLFVLIVHCLVWTGCLSIAMHHLGIWALWKSVFLFTGHLSIDYWKCNVYKKTPLCQQKNLKHLYLDQALHILQVVFVGLF